MLSVECHAQIGEPVLTRPRPLLKAGGFIYASTSGYNGFSFHLEFERTFKRLEYLTTAPRIDYVNINRYPEKNLFVGYEVKFYPLYWKFREAYRGISIGVEPLMLIKSEAVPYARYGPGLGSLIGYQYLFKDKISVGLEGSMIYLQNLNKDSKQYPGYVHPSERYFYFFACLKLGIRI